MDEHQWLTCIDFAPMIAFLEGRTTERKCRLFACGICRYFWTLLTDARSRHAVEVAEQYADGRANKDQLLRARSRAMDVYVAASDVSRFAAEAAFITTQRRLRITDVIPESLRFWYDSGSRIHGPEGRAALARLIRELFGNPFRAVAFDPARRNRGNEAAQHMAQVIQEDRAFHLLPVLGDALIDAECLDERILEHCRQEEGHVLGCWVVDLVLGKQ